MASNEVFAVSLRLRDPAKDLGALLADWGLQAWRSWQAGQLRTAPKGRPLAGTWPDSYATARLELPENRALAACLDHALATTDHVSAQICEFVDAGGYAELFIGWRIESSSGSVLGPEMMRRLSNRRLALSFDISLEGIAMASLIEGEGCRLAPEQANDKT